MNHLRELLDSRRDTLFSAVEMGAQSFEAMHTVFSGLASSAICFDMGETSALESLRVIDELCILPFRTCWFECDTKGADPMLLGVLAHQHDSGLVSMFAWAKRKKVWVYHLSADMQRLPPDGSTLVVYPDIYRDSFYYYAKCVFAFLSALNCTNVRREMHEPDFKLQKARARRGKKPLFSYWTLHLNGNSEHVEYRGGTHAGPRLHLRRGHPRQFLPGKWTWVQAHAVGNKALGLVQKDYVVGPALLMAAAEREF